MYTRYLREDLLFRCSKINRNMFRLLSMMAVLQLAVSEVDVYEHQRIFKSCRSFLDKYALSDCQYAQNIHICTDIYNGRIESRGKQELNRLGCTRGFQACRHSNIWKCRTRYPTESCKELQSMKKCLYVHGCKEHYKLLNEYYTNNCSKPVCQAYDALQCHTSPLFDIPESVCPSLETDYKCVLRRNGYPENECKMPIDWEYSYMKNDCENPCYTIPKPNLNVSHEDKTNCNELNKYILLLNSSNCKMPYDMEKQYKSLKCDTICNEVSRCSIYVRKTFNRIANCMTLSYGLECFKKAKCPIDQDFFDMYSFYGCKSSCNANVLSACYMELKEPMNSTRQEQCGYYKEARDCREKSRCIIDNEEYNYLDCGAASLNTMFSFIISVLLTVQMLDKYISIS